MKNGRRKTRWGLLSHSTRQAALLVIAAWTLGGALPASGQGEGGYPAPYLTAMWVMPVATHNPGPTNTPVPVRNRPRGWR